MMKRFCLGLIGFILPCFIYSQTTSAVHFTVAPYLQCVGENEFTVVFSTDVECVSSLEVAPSDGSHFNSKPRKTFFQYDRGIRPITTLHSIKVSGLPLHCTTYRYRVCIKPFVGENKATVLLGEMIKGDIYTAHLLDRHKDTIRFSVTNDVHERTADFCSMFKNIQKAHDDFVFFNGDMSNDIIRQDKIAKTYLSDAARLFASEIPLFTSRGNHEHRGKEANCYSNWFPTSAGKTYYTFRCGPVFFIVLDSGESRADSLKSIKDIIMSDSLRTEEAKWLEKVVTSTEFRKAPMHIVFSHIPFFNYSNWYGGKNMNRLMAPILNKVSIDLLICGDLHEYKFYKKGTFNCQFPILCNSNCERMDVTACKKNINIKIYNPTEEQTHSITLSPNIK